MFSETCPKLRWNMKKKKLHIKERVPENMPVLLISDMLENRDLSEHYPIISLLLIILICIPYTGGRNELVTQFLFTFPGNHFYKYNDIIQT